MVLYRAERNISGPKKLDAGQSANNTSESPLSIFKTHLRKNYSYRTPRGVNGITFGTWN